MAASIADDALAPPKSPLRVRAQAVLDANGPDDSNVELTAQALRHTVHELRVHQVELEMQNEHLRQSQNALERARARYQDLYDTAPVGYCSVTEDGLIVYANLTLAHLLCVTRSALLHQPVSRFVAPPDQDHFYLMRRRLFTQAQSQTIELHMVKQDGTPFVGCFRSTCAVDEEGTRVLRMVLTDITERKAAQDKIKQMALYDPLTGLPNRRLLLNRLKKALTHASRRMREGALLFVDLDRFKQVNDRLGHHMGDVLLQEVAQRLKSCVRAGDTVARLGGDEFVVMLADLNQDSVTSAAQAKAVGQKILAALSRPCHLGGHACVCTGSVGIALFSGEQTVEELIKQADLAMFQAKSDGRNALRFFDPAMQAAVVARAALEAALCQAVAGQQMVLHYQAQLYGDCVVGAEVLVRWQHPQRGLVCPADFIALAEETGLILLLGQWVLQEACSQLARWSRHPLLADLTLAVNVSARQFHQSDFVDQVQTILAATGANPTRLKLELTESMLVVNVEDTIAQMNILKACGVGFSLDDFGTGYSSLAYLKRLPLDQLKIDQSFVKNIVTDANDAAIAKMVIALAQSLGLNVIAEGVETVAQRDFLLRLGCHSFQGYFYSQPLPLQGFVSLVGPAHGI